MRLFRRQSPRPSLWDDPTLRAARLAERKAMTDWYAALDCDADSIDDELRLMIARTRAVDAMNRSIRALMLLVDPTSREALDRHGF